MTVVLNDENFEKEITNTDKLVVVDFFATWCGPCTILAPILEKVVEDLKEKVVLFKVNVDDAPNAAGKFNVEKIPTVVLFKSGQAVSGFVGMAPEEAVKKWLEGFLKGEVAGDKLDIKGFIDLSSKYAEGNGFKLNPDEKVVERVVKGLFANEEKHGKKYCPCRRVTGIKEEDEKKICPCAWHKEEIEKDGHCFCNLFVK